MKHATSWMRRTPSGKLSVARRSVLALLLLGAFTQVQAEVDTAGFVENVTFYRESRGISKFRNTGQFEFSKAFENSNVGLTLNGTLRATYDGVYDINDEEWGDKAGGSIQLQSQSLPVLAPGAPGHVAYGSGLSYTTAPPPGLPPTLGFTTGTGGINDEVAWNQMFGTNAGLVNVRNLANPNSGLESLGARRGGIEGGIQLGVPVRACDEDKRGCQALEGYMDKDGDELSWSDFNDQLDFIRELYVSGTVELDNDHQFGFKVGKQQIVWGRTDLFRVLDVINPVDYSRNNIYDELEDIRIPQWAVEVEYRWGPIGAFDDLNLSMVWNFDKFRPHNLGQAGTPYQVVEAGSLFRSLANCWENGCTVGNFAADLTGDGLPERVAMDFGPGIIGIRDVELPSWSLSNTQVGIKLEGVLNDVGFSFNVLEYRQQLPSIRGVATSIDPFSINPAAPAPPSTADYPYALAFDIAFPRVTLVGGSLDFYLDSIKSTFRMELAWTDGEEFADSSVPEFFSASEVVRWVVGWDRNTFIPWLNRRRAFLLSAQVFGQRILEHNEVKTTFGPTGMPEYEENYLFTLLFQGWYQNDRLNPQLIIAHDMEGGHTTVAPALEWIPDDHWQITLRANYKLGEGVEKWDDARGTFPFPGMTVMGIPAALIGQNIGPKAGPGANPIARLREGPLGMASEEDEIQLSVRYRF